MVEKKENNEDKIELTLEALYDVPVQVFQAEQSSSRAQSAS